eukprot:1549072-Rhodomonas_salina.1
MAGTLRMRLSLELSLLLLRKSAPNSIEFITIISIRGRIPGFSAATVYNCSISVKGRVFRFQNTAPVNRRAPCPGTRVPGYPVKNTRGYPGTPGTLYPVRYAGFKYPVL